MMRIAIFGATSAIAEATARQWAGEEARFFLVGRDETALGDIAADLKARGAAEVITRQSDLRELDGLAGLCRDAEGALGRIDVALIAHGVLPDQRIVGESSELFLDLARINALSPGALMIELRKIMKRQRHGSLVVLSSVAGDRGRPSNWVYGGAKAMLSVMGEGMGLELDSAGVNVLVVKPGFVDTPMTADFPKGPLWASTDQVAGSIVRAVRTKRRGVLYAPGWWRWIMLVVAFAPDFLVKRL